MASGLPAREFDRATPTRRQRIAEVVAPLVTKGLTSRAIAKLVGISQPTAQRDMWLCKQMWLKKFENAGEDYRGRILSTYEMLQAELWEQWEKAKQGRTITTKMPDGSVIVRQEPADLKAISGLLAVTKEVSTYLGLREGADTVARLEVDEATRHALAPMSNEAYLALLAASGGNPVVTTRSPRPGGLSRSRLKLRSAEHLRSVPAGPSACCRRAGSADGLAQELGSSDEWTACAWLVSSHLPSGSDPHQ